MIDSIIYLIDAIIILFIKNICILQFFTKLSIEVDIKKKKLKRISHLTQDAEMYI